MRISEHEGQILARCLAEAVKVKIKLGNDNEWLRLREEAIYSLDSFDEIGRHTFEKIRHIVLKVVKDYRSKSAVITDQSILINAINAMLIDAIDSVDVQAEWQEEREKKRFSYNCRFLLERIQSLKKGEFGSAYVPNATNKIIGQLIDSLNELESFIYLLSVSSNIPADEYKVKNEQLTLAIATIARIAKDILDEEPIDAINLRLITVINSFNSYLSKVQEAIKAYRFGTSCSGGFFNFFTIEDAKDKACIKTLKSLMKKKANDQVTEAVIKNIISDFEKKQSNFKSILLTTFQHHGLVERRKKQSSPLKNEENFRTENSLSHLEPPLLQRETDSDTETARERQLLL